MSTCTTSADQTTDVPTAPAGSRYRYALVRSGLTTFADTLGELIAAVIPNYGAGDDESAMLARWASLVATVNDVQQLHAAALGLDPGNETEDALTAIFHDRTQPLPRGVVGDRWDHRVPLLLLATDYEPFTDLVPPSGNVTLLDSSTERSYLESLTTLGVAQLYTLEHEES